MVGASLHRNRVLLAFAGTALLSLLVSIPNIAFADTTPKVQLTIVAPATVDAGSTVGFTVDIKNEAVPQQLGSANLTIPAGFLFNSAAFSGPTPAGATINPPASGGSVIELRNLQLQSTNTQRVIVTLLVPCDYTNPNSWTIRAKQSNDFSGLPGNDFALDPASQLATTIQNHCSTDFTSAFSGQPTSAVKTKTISTSAFVPTADPVQVALLDGGGNLITAPSLQTSVTLKNGVVPTLPPAAAGARDLKGTLTHTTSGGTATFPSIHIDTTGVGYTIVADAAALSYTDGQSQTFDITDDGKPCTGVGNCTGHATDGTTTIDVTTAGTPPAGTLLSVAIGVEDVTCGSYVPISSEVTFGVNTASVGSIVTLTIAKGSIPKKRTLASVQICFGKSATGTILPDCSANGNVPPCVITRTHDPKGNWVIQYSAPAGDPRGRG